MSKSIINVAFFIGLTCININAHQIGALLQGFNFDNGHHLNINSVQSDFIFKNTAALKHDSILLSDGSHPSGSHGSLWVKHPSLFKNWQATTSFFINNDNPHHRGGNGFAFWYTETDDVGNGELFGGNRRFHGLSIIFDTIKGHQNEDGSVNVFAAFNDGKEDYLANENERKPFQKPIIGHCKLNLHNINSLVTLQVVYKNHKLSVDVNDGKNGFISCLSIDNFFLSHHGWHFGLSSSAAPSFENPDKVSVRGFEIHELNLDQEEVKEAHHLHHFDKNTMDWHVHGEEDAEDQQEEEHVNSSDSHHSISAHHSEQIESIIQHMQTLQKDVSHHFNELSSRMNVFTEHANTLTAALNQLSSIVGNGFKTHPELISAINQMASDTKTHLEKVHEVAHATEQFNNHFKSFGEPKTLFQHVATHGSSSFGWFEIFFVVAGIILFAALYIIRASKNEDSIRKHF